MQTPDDAPTAPAASLPLKKILGGVAVAIVLLVAFLINPDAAIETYVSSLVQVVGVCIIWFAGKAIVTAIRNRQGR